MPIPRHVGIFVSGDRIGKIVAAAIGDFRKAPVLLDEFQQRGRHVRDGRNALRRQGEVMGAQSARIGASDRRRSLCSRHRACESDRSPRRRPATWDRSNSHRSHPNSRPACSSCWSPPQDWDFRSGSNRRRRASRRAREIVEAVVLADDDDHMLDGSRRRLSEDWRGRQRDESARREAQRVEMRLERHDTLQ